MNKKLTILTISLFATSMISGCAMLNSTIPDMSEEEQGMVVEYATETLLHYDRKNGDKIKPKTYTVVDEEGREIPMEEVEAQIADGQLAGDDTVATPSPEPVMEMLDESGVTEDDVDLINEQNPSENSYAKIEEALGLSDVTIEYSGYEVCDYYPEDMSNYFVMNATEGCKLLVVKFNISNLSGIDKNVSMPYQNIRYKINLNGNTKNALTTLLLNDMATYEEMIPAGGNDELVVVGEYKNEDITSVDTLQLVIKGAEGNSTFNLK